MKSRSKFGVAIGAIAGGSLLAFCCGLLLTVMIIIPAREGRSFLSWPSAEPTEVVSPSVGVDPVARRTPVTPSAAPTYSLIITTPTPHGSVSSPEPSATATPAEQPPPPPPPTPAPRFPFFYVEGSRQEEEQCVQPYLQGWVVDSYGVPLNGVTVRWQYWDRTEYAVSGDPQLYWQKGQFKFTYYGRPHRETDFVLQVVESEANPVPLSEPLKIHYAGCSTMGQITNIVFKRR